MSLHRLFAMLVGCFTLLAVITAAVADDKAANKDKIVGKWQLTKSGGKRPSESVVIELTKDGKVKITTTLPPGVAKGGKKTPGQTINSEATYKVDGDKLIVVLKDGDNEEKKTVTIKTLTDKKFVTVDERGQEEEFEKK